MSVNTKMLARRETNGTGRVRDIIDAPPLVETQIIRETPPTRDSARRE
jgi:hypothetical protein